jgi:hypothetical protein
MPLLHSLGVDVHKHHIPFNNNLKEIVSRLCEILGDTDLRQNTVACKHPFAVVFAVCAGSVSPIMGGV